MVTVETARAAVIALYSPQLGCTRHSAEIAGVGNVFYPGDNLFYP